MFDPVHLRTLVAVVRSGSFADAARHLGYTGSAVSQQISTLERQLQIVLFEREAQRIRPTPAAEFFASRAVEVLAALGALEDDMRSVAEGTVGRLRIGSFPTASERLLPSAIARFLTEHRDVEVVLDEQEPADLVPRLQSGNLDLALVYRYDLVPGPRWQGVDSVDLLHEDLLLLLTADHPQHDQASVALADLQRSTWIATRKDTTGAACLETMCAQVGFAPAVAFRSNDYDVIHEFVRSGVGIALVPYLSHAANADLTARRLMNPLAQRHVSVLHRAPASNPALNGMLDAVKESARALVDNADGLCVAGSDL